jgi:hypothetical protein
VIKVRIENSYTDGHESESTVEVEAPQSIEALDEVLDGAEDTWWQEVVFDHTGDGHYVEVYEETGERLGSCYTATIIEADDPALVGRTHEWID